MSPSLESLISNSPFRIVRLLVFSLLSLISLSYTPNARSEIVTYTMGNSTWYTSFTSGTAGIFENAGGTELGMYANTSGNKEVVAWRNFMTTGNNTGTARSLQVGDQFTVTVSATSALGGIGFSLNDNGVQGGNYTNRVSGSRLFVQEVGTAASWEVNSASGTGGYTSLNYNVGTTRRDYAFRIYITSESTANVLMTVDGVDYRAYNLALNGTSGANIDAFSLWLKDDYNGANNANIFWKPTTSVQNNGFVELGYFMSNGSFTSGVITDGLEANSTTSASINSVLVGGDAGSQVNLATNNTYTGNTTINSGAAAEAQHANALGTTAAGTSVTSGGALKLYSPTAISYAAEALTLNGVGVSNVNGALRNVGGNNTWNGNITLGSNSRINADITGGAGSLAINGTVSGGANVLFVGANDSNIAINGIISGEGGTQDTTTTSLYKDGNATLTLSAANTYTGDTRIVAGTLAVSGSGNLGSGSDVFISSGAQLNLNSSSTVASVQEVGNLNGGTISIGSGATLTVNGANRGTFYQNSISGAGGLTFSGTGNSTLSLYGNQSYTGTTTVSSGSLTTAVAMASTAYVISGGSFSTQSNSQIENTATIALSGGNFTIGGSDTVGAISGSGGTINLGNNTLFTSTTTTTTFSGSIVGVGGGFTKTGAGTLTLGGSSTYTGATAVSAGTLIVNGSLGASAVAVESGATLGGSGSVGGLTTLNSGATLAPGDGIGTMGFSAGLTLNSNSTVRMQISDTNGSADRINVTGGTLTYAGNLVFDTVSMTGVTNNTYTLFNGTATGTWATVAAAGTYTGAFSQNGTIWTRNAGDGNVWTYDQNAGTLTVIPEPSTWALIGVGSAFVLWRLRRRRDD
jgi:autotransporter-associated beta strand protein